MSHLRLYSHRYFSLIFVFAIFLILPLSAAVIVANVMMRGNTQSHAAGRDQTLLVKPVTETEFVSNEILVKVKKTVKANIKAGNSLDTGAVSLNKINKDIGAIKFEKFIQQSGKSRADADVFSWYKVTIGDGQEILSDKDTRPTILWLKYLQTGITSKDPKELKKQKLKAATARLLSDPNIEAVEFNFVVRALQADPVPPVAKNSTTACQNPGVNGNFSVFFNWTLASGANFDQQQIEYSADPSFPPNGTSNVPLTMTATSYTESRQGFFQRNSTYFWRIGAHTTGGTWLTSNTVSFVGPDCMIVIPTPTPTPPATQPCPTSSQNIPNDPYSCTSGAWGQTYPDLWGIKKINVENAWKRSTGSAQVVVASVDTGVDRNHEDLTANMWTNSGESGSTTQEGPAPNCTSRGLSLDRYPINYDKIL